MPTRENQPMCSPAPSAETTKQPQKQVPRQCRGPRSWCSREQSLVLPTHKLHRASGAPAGRRENPDQNRQGGGPGKKLLATTLLISVSINLYDTLETSEREQSRLGKKKKNILRPWRTDAWTGAWAQCWECECLLGLSCQTVAARCRPCLSLTVPGAGLAGPAFALARAKFKSTKLFKRKENLKIPDRP